MLPEAVVSSLRAAFSQAQIVEIAPTHGGFSHHSSFIQIDGTRYVAKSAALPGKRADLRNEAAVLQLLAASDLPIPRASAPLETAEWTTELLSVLDGTPGIRLFSEQPTVLPAAFGELGGLLARVHRVSLVNESTRDALALSRRFAQVRAEVSTLPLDPALHAVLQDGLAHPIWQGAPQGLIHGDPGVHNLLWQGHVTGLIDWEWAGWGPLAFDLAWVHWTIAWRRLDSACWQAFLAAYGQGAPPEEALHALALGQIAAIMCRVRELPPAMAEWERRLRWTIGQD